MSQLRSTLLRLLAPLLLGLCLTGRAEAQFYTVQSYWNIDAAGVPTPTNPYLVLSAPTWAGFDPRISVAGLDSLFPWTTMTLTQTAGPVGAPLFGPLTVTNGATGCTAVANSACANLPANPRAGIYTFTAVVSPGLAAGIVRIVVGGGSGPPLAGPRTFRVVGNSTGVGYSYGLSIGDANPVMVVQPPQPVGAPAVAFAAAFATSINGGGTGFTAVAAGPTFTVTAPAGELFRFWIGDAAGLPDCQVTGGACEFNPEIIDSTSVASVPAMPGPVLVVAVLLLLATALYALLRWRCDARTA